MKQIISVIDQAFYSYHSDFTPGNYVLLTLTDDGCGMEEDTLTKIFKPFFTSKGDERGTGLGLSTVYGIAIQNKGIINVHSTPGQGTIFKIYLPQKKHSQVEKTPPRRLEATSPGTETILLVEDETAVLRLGTDLFEQQGYTVLAARKPSEALELALEHAGTIELLLVDVIMPEMNGRELAANILDIMPEIKILSMSGYTADIIGHHGVMEPDVHFLEKPFNLEELDLKVRAVLDRR